MARQYGRSQAWEAVRSKLGPLAATIACPRELEAAAAARVVARDGWPAEAALRVRDEQAGRLAQIRAMAAGTDAARATATATVASEVDVIAGRLAAIDRRWPWPSWLVGRLFRVPELRERRDALHRQVEHAVDRHRALIDSLRSIHARVEADPSAAVEEIVRNWTAELARFEAARASPEYSGGLAELEVVGLLVAGLPEQYAVFVDADVRLTKARQVDGEYRKTAQIDVVVVGPRGLFVIEVKRWSARFAQEGSSQNPFDQIHGSSRVCYHYILAALGREMKTNDVLATDGALPPAGPGRFARVVRPRDLCGHILGGSRQHLSEADVHEITSVLTRCVRR